jgi:uncharacterized membrane protein
VTHAHGHGSRSAWSEWPRHPAMVAVLVAVVAAAVATVVGLVVLWPDGHGRDDAIARADEIGLVTDRIGATVRSVTDAPCSYSTDENPVDCRTIVVVPDEGPDESVEVNLGELSLAPGSAIPDVDVGDSIVLGFEPSTNFYFYADRERRAPLLWLTIAFAAVVVALGRLRGVLALVALAATIVVLVGFVAPSVLDGHDPLLVAVVAASAVAFLTIYLTHGFTPETTVALAATLAALALTLLIAGPFFAAMHFTGLATEEGLTLPLVAGDVDLSSLLLGGAVIGALGALDDITITQVATVAELHHRSPSLSARELVASGIRVGREHIASTVNTLLLAYVGASMPLLLLFALSEQSLDIVANSEVIAVEIARTLCGSIGLVAAVPLSTVLAAAVVGSGSEPPPEDAGPGAGRGSVPGTTAGDVRRAPGGAVTPRRPPLSEAVGIDTRRRPWLEAAGS